MTEEFDDIKIAAIMTDIIAKLKPFVKDGAYFMHHNSEHKCPEYYEGYNQIVEQYKSVLVHSKVGYFPDKLFAKRAPNMTEEDFTYTKENYKSWTVPIFIDFLNSVNRMYNGGNYNIIWPKDDEVSDQKYKGENSLREYLEKGITEYGSLENFIKYIFTKTRLQDVNGCIVVRPESFIKNEDHESELGFQYYEDITELRRPMPYYYDCTKVIRPPKEYAVIELHEKSEVMFQGKKQRMGYIWEFHTENEIYRIIQTGKFTDWEFTIKLLVKHDIGIIQVKLNGGLPEIIDGHIRFVAEMLYAVGNLDLVILNKSNLQTGNNNGVFPIRVMLGNDCEFTDNSTGRKCIGGYTYENTTMGTGKMPCPKCMGSGLKSRISAMGTILIKPPNQLNGEPDIKASDVIHSHSTETSTLEFLLKCINEDWTRARSILHLKTDSNSSGENPVESANLAKANYAFIKPISDQVFNMWQWIINQCGAWREGSAYKPVKVIPPINFDILNEQDYLNEIKDATAAGLPPFVIRSIVTKFLSTLYYTDKEISKAFHLLMETDELLTLSDNAISIGQTKGTIANWQIILHNSGINMINELSRTVKGFFDLDLTEQIKQLNEKAQEKERLLNESSPSATLENSNLNNFNGQ